MNYKTFEENNECYFKYSPTKIKINKFANKSKNKDNPFSVLKNINFK